MRIYWPCMMDLPQCSYEVLAKLHGTGIKVNCSKVVRWQEIDALAEYLKRHRDRDGWVYAMHHMVQIEIAARTSLPFRVLDFFTPNPDGAVELAAVMQVEGKERKFLYTNPFFHLNEHITAPLIDSSVH